jgi:carbamate kinase
MTTRSHRPVSVVALGGNALVQRGQRPTWDQQEQSAHIAGQHLAELAVRNQLVITHGNGPQVGVLSAAQSVGDAAYPLDALDAETAGMIGSLLVLALKAELPKTEIATIVTHTIVRRDDPAFDKPSKPIGLMLTKEQADALVVERGYSVAPDGDRWRRVVPSPEPQGFLELSVIQRLVADEVLTICAGGGGVPVAVDTNGNYEGVEAVVDKDLVSALLAIELDADSLVLLTDVRGVMRGWGTPDAALIEKLTVSQARSLDLPAGSMRPKVEACCRFAEATGREAIISALSNGHSVQGTIISR